MAVDWTATGSWMQAWAGFAQAGAILYAGKRGVDAFRTWRMQKIEERRLDTAEAVLTLAYRLRRAFETIRQPMMPAHELTEANKILRAQHSEADLARFPKNLTHAQAVFARIDHFRTEWDDLLATIPVARAYLGEELEQALQRFWRQRGVVAVAAESYADDRGGDAEFSEQLKRNLWQGWGTHRGGSNEVDDEIAAAFADIEARIRPILVTSVNAVEGRNAAS